MDNDEVVGLDFSGDGFCELGGGEDGCEGLEAEVGGEEKAEAPAARARLAAWGRRWRRKRKAASGPRKRLSAARARGRRKRPRARVSRSRKWPMLRA